MPKARKVAKIACPAKRRTSILTGQKVRWGSVLELDRRTHAGTEAWRRRHEELRQRKLSAWRALHKLATHRQIRALARSRGLVCSSNLNLHTVLAEIRRRRKGIK